MSAQNTDILYAERLGIPGTLTVQDISDLLSPFLPTPDLIDDTDQTYFYMGWESVNGGWLVRRQLRSNASFEDATTGYADLTTAWPNRETLGYS